MTAIRKEESAKPTERTERWALDAPSLAILLNAFDSDPDEAGKKYAQLRERLNRFFEWNGVEEADELADEALDRLARRIANTTSDADAINNPTQFVGGIARLLVRENWRKRQRTERTFATLGRTVADGSEDTEENEERTACLDTCLKELSAENRSLICRYYGADGLTLIESRKKLADELAMSLNALRNRAMRLRIELEARVRTRMSNRSAR